jgi:predicted metal-dependent phosphoesterase TrpH
MKLKADLHLHSKENATEKIEYSAIELINAAQLKGFDVISITNHDVITYDRYLREYAEERGILLIPGVEATVEGKHVLLYNIKNFHNFPTLTFETISHLKAEDNLVVAPHPFFPSPHALQTKAYEHIELFDAIEYCGFIIGFFDFNKKAKKISQHYDLPLIGGSDTHDLMQLDTTYTFIEADKNVESVIKAIKSQKVDIKNHAFTLESSGKLLWKFFFQNPINLYRFMLYLVRKNEVK